MHISIIWSLFIHFYSSIRPFQSSLLNQAIIKNKLSTNFIVASDPRYNCMAQALKQKWKEKILDRRDAILKEKGVDAELLKTVGPINPRTLPGVLWKHPQILPEKMRAKINKSMQDLALYVLTDAAVGIGINLLMRRLYAPLRKISRVSRMSARLAMFAMPFAGTYPQLMQKIEDYRRNVDAVAALMEKVEKFKQAKDSLT